ncbi:hypothetical protein KUTeg_014156 [Tegillarca granosa]|uniref:HAT C-terminal dimerisation domain-containing protein n=1 Tax=Tegillarca granosa TaxID=220873 RepID=A0ABQ9F076_TEGGR|nr:hypothetical protein KUTeg_014156 [Tegillarca granosa]
MNQKKENSRMNAACIFCGTKALNEVVCSYLNDEVQDRSNQDKNMEVEKLQQMKYQELQKLAKKHGIKANMKIDKLRKALKDYYEKNADEIEKENKKTPSKDNSSKPLPKVATPVQKCVQSTAAKSSPKPGTPVVAQRAINKSATPRTTSPIITQYKTTPKSAPKIVKPIVAQKNTPKSNTPNVKTSSGTPKSNTPKVSTSIPKPNTPKDSKAEVAANKKRKISQTITPQSESGSKSKRRRSTFEVATPTNNLTPQVNIEEGSNKRKRRSTFEITPDIKPSADKQDAGSVEQGSKKKKSKPSVSPGVQEMITAMDVDKGDEEMKNTLLKAIDKKVKTAQPSEESTDKKLPTQIPRFAAFLAKKKEEEEANKKKLTPGNKDWAKIHQKHFDKMESIDDYLKKKKQQREEVTASVKKARQILEDTKAAVSKLQNYKTPVKSLFRTPSENSKKPFKPTVFSTKNMDFNFSKSNRKSPRNSCGSIKKPFKPSVLSTSNMNLNFSSMKTPQNLPRKKSLPNGSTAKSVSTVPRKSTGVTPFRFTATLNQSLNESKSVKKFDLKASLSRPVTWKMHTGKIKPVEKIPSYLGPPVADTENKKQPKTPLQRNRDQRRIAKQKQRKDKKWQNQIITSYQYEHKYDLDDMLSFLHFQQFSSLFHLMKSDLHILKDSDSDSGKCKAKCVHCSSIISANLKVTSNFVTHMKRKHRDIYITDNEKRVQEQPKMSEFMKKKVKYASTDRRQIQLTDALIKFIAGDLLPLSIVENEDFRNLMETADPKYQMPSRKYLSSKLLLENSTEVRNNIMHQMKLAENINIRNEYEEIIASFDIAKKIVAIVSDNASNMVKAFSIPGYEDEDISQDQDSDESDNEVSSSDQEADSDFDICLPQHVRCYAHSLQLLVKDGLKECSTHLKTIVNKASQIVNHVRKSVNASDLLEDCNRLQAANVTRWNSQLHMLRSKVKLSSYERKLLQELCNILEPFEKATLLVQSENSASASLAIPVTCGLKHQICQISIDYSSKMISTLKHSIHSRLSVYENDDSFTIAAILDPRFKLRWCENEKVTKIIDLLKEKNNQIYAPVSLDDNPVSPPCKKVKQDDFFSFMPSTSTPSRQRHISGKSANTEVDEYLDEPCILMSENPILYWQNNTCRFPNLAKLACQVLCIPATSAPVERMSSVAGKTFRPDRCRLGDKTFENLMMIKCNAKNMS